MSDEMDIARTHLSGELVEQAPPEPAAVDQADLDDDDWFVDEADGEWTGPSRDEWEAVQRLAERLGPLAEFAQRLEEAPDQGFEDGYDYGDEDERDPSYAGYLQDFVQDQVAEGMAPFEEMMERQSERDAREAAREQAEFEARRQAQAAVQAADNEQLIAAKIDEFAHEVGAHNVDHGQVYAAASTLLQDIFVGLRAQGFSDADIKDVMVRNDTANQLLRGAVEQAKNRAIIDRALKRV